jgi:hypothetical protein
MVFGPRLFPLAMSAKVGFFYQCVLSREIFIIFFFKWVKDEILCYIDKSDSGLILL